MKISHPEKPNNFSGWIYQIAAICGSLTAISGGLILALWYTGTFDQILPGQRFIPMADETALLFVLLGIAIPFFLKGTRRGIISSYLVLSASFTLILSVLAIVDFGTDSIWNLSNILRREHVMMGTIQTGRISLPAAVCFLLLALAQLLMLGRTKSISVIFSATTLFTSYIVVLGYFYGVPFLYGGYTIPMALPTAILFIVSSLGYILAAGKDSFPVRYFIGDSVRARLLRILIPTIFVLSQVQSFILSRYSGEFGSSFAVTNGVSGIVLMLISGVVIFSISRSLGTKIDKNLAERKEAEEKMRESEERFRSIFENNAAPIAIIEPDSMISMVNNAYCEMSGYSREEVIGMSWTLQIPPWELERLLEFKRRRLLDPKDAPYNYEFAFYHKNGELRHGLISVKLLMNKKVIISVIDITAQKLLNQKISQLAALVESSNDFIISKTVDGVITSWNKGAETIYGYTADEMIGQPITLLTPSDMEDQIARILECVKSGVSIDHFETVRLKKDGQLINVSITISPIKNEKGEIIGASTIGHDISGRKRMEEELALKTDQLVRLNNEKDKFFSIIAHDLRSPFNGFLGLTEVMANELPKMTNDEIREISLILNRSAINLYNLLGNLLEWSYMQRGFTSFVPSEFLLQQELDECLKLTIEVATKKEIGIIFEIPEDLTVYADIKMFESIIRNLTNNGVKYSLRGGKVTISAIVISENRVQISVADAGIGMSQQLISDLFLIDVKTARKGTEGESSTGLGLIICKDFIEKHGGKLWVESEEGKGSVFRFTLPLKLME